MTVYEQAHSMFDVLIISVTFIYIEFGIYRMCLLTSSLLLFTSGSSPLELQASVSLN